MRLIGDGAVDREGVAGLAARLGYSERQLHRLLVAEVGAGAQALARAQRAHTARTLVETTDLPLSEVAFAAGFASIRQFNDTVRAVFATTPRDLRDEGHRPRQRRRPRARWCCGWPPGGRSTAGGCSTCSPSKSVPGVESYDGTTFRRALLLPHGEATVDLTPGRRPRAGDPAPRGPARRRPRRGPVPAAARPRRRLGRGRRAARRRPAAGAARRGPARAPGARLRSTAPRWRCKAVIGQQVSVAGARHRGRPARHGVREAADPHGGADGGLTHHFPTADVLASVDPETLPMPARSGPHAGAAWRPPPRTARSTSTPAPTATRSRPRCWPCPASDPGPPTTCGCGCSATPTASSPSDLGVRRGLERLGAAGDPRSAADRAEAWRPWRSYALMHLWEVAMRPTTDRKDPA